MFMTEFQSNEANEAYVTAQTARVQKVRTEVISILREQGDLHQSSVRERLQENPEIGAYPLEELLAIFALGDVWGDFSDVEGVFHLLEKK